jgi:predicted GH43/DUF377 family glycosyl hydrolase
MRPYFCIIPRGRNPRPSGRGWTEAVPQGLPSVAWACRFLPACRQAGNPRWLIARVGSIFLLVFCSSTVVVSSPENVPVAVEPALVLEVGPPGSWDAKAVYSPIVMKEDGKFFMLYTGSDVGVDQGNNAIGLATSEDGVRWTKYPENPVLKKSKKPNDWNGHILISSGPALLKKNGIYWLWYSGHNKGPSRKGSAGIAFSRDLIHWKNYSKNPVIESDLEDMSAWDRYGSVFPSVIVMNGRLRMYYLGGNGTMNYGHGIAESTDGIHWEKYPGNPVLESGKDTNVPDAYYAPCNFGILPFAGGYFDVYEAQTWDDFEKKVRSEKIQICLAYSRDGIHFKKYPVAFLSPDMLAFDKSVSNVWSPAFALGMEDQETQYLYFGFSQDKVKGSIGLAYVGSDFLKSLLKEIPPDTAP